MGPDLYWVAILALGGLAMGVVTTFVGLAKGHEFIGWVLLYSLMVAAAAFLQVPAPFWTVLVASVAANLVASLVQVAFLPMYRRRNPWFADELAKPLPRVATGLFGFSLFAGIIFGIIASTFAWGLSLL